MDHANGPHLPDTDIEAAPTTYLALKPTTPAPTHLMIKPGPTWGPNPNHPNQNHRHPNLGPNAPTWNNDSPGSCVHKTMPETSRNNVQMRRLLEICCYSVEDARVAQACGADRIELCAGRPEGGTTPSIGFLTQALSEIQIPIFPMVRPRGGDFVFGPDEFATMRRDVEVVATLGFPGVVLGILTFDGQVDVVRTSELIECGRSINPDLSVTFHRAFDAAADPISAYQDVAATGANRLLTSGQQPTAPAGAQLIGELIRGQGGGPVVMPGSGVRPENVATFLELGALEIHSTATDSDETGINPATVTALAELIHRF